MLLLLLLKLLSVVCQAEPLTERFVVELEQNAVFTNQSFSVKDDQHKWPDSPSDITDTNGYARSDLPLDEKRHKPVGYGVKTTLIESISWQWLCATHLLVSYKLILTTKDSPLCYTPYSWVPVEDVWV